MKPISTEEMKQIELSIMERFDAFCRERDLRYYLSCGTLLGAARHKGYIPWDDDIDLMMPRDDYERFYTAFMDENDDSTLQLTSYRDKSSIYPFFKVCDPRTLVVERFVDPQYTSGVWIDIFPLDGVPDDDTSPFDVNRDTKRLYKLATANPKEGSTFGKRLVKRMAHPVFKHVDIYEAARKLDEKCASNPIREGKDIALIVWTDKWGHTLPYSMLETIDMEFEGRMFMAPKEYDHYLRSRYGDYMQLPPEEDRVPHPCEAYWLD